MRGANRRRRQERNQAPLLVERLPSLALRQLGPEVSGAAGELCLSDMMSSGISVPPICEKSKTGGGHAEGKASWDIKICHRRRELSRKHLPGCKSLSWKDRIQKVMLFFVFLMTGRTKFL